MTAPLAAPAPDGLRNTLPGRLAAHALERPGAVALREKRLGVWQEVTWSAYWEAVQATALMLEHLGVGPGDHVAILSENRPEWLYADLGAQALGARSVGIYQTNPPADVEYVLRHCGARVLFCEDQEQVDKAVEIADRTPEVKHIVVFDPRGLRHYEDPRLRAWIDFLRDGHALLRERPTAILDRVRALDPEAGAMVVYTSGTTGDPKGAVLSSRNALAPADSITPLLGVGPEDQLLSYLPLCHVAEKIFTLFMPLTVGAVVHFGESIATVQSDVREVSPTVFLGVPRIWEKLHSGIEIRIRDTSWLKRRLFHWAHRTGARVAEKRRAGKVSVVDRLFWRLADLLVLRPLQERLGLRRCRLPVSGAAPISADLVRWFHGAGVPILEGYGQTEGAGVSHVNRPDAFRIGSVGQVLPGIECRLDDDGEILVRSDAVFLGYLHDEAATKQTVDAERWLHTGDVGEVDSAGYLTITGRKKEIIVTAGGKNLSPEKIENALKMSPFVKEAVAVGDARRFVSALIQIELDTVGDWATRKGLPYTSFEDLAAKPEVVELVQSVIDEANERLARVEQVRAFRLLPKQLNQDDGELTATQKVRRRIVVDRFETLIEEMYG